MSHPCRLQHAPAPAIAIVQSCELAPAVCGELVDGDVEPGTLCDDGFARSTPPPVDLVDGRFGRPVGAPQPEAALVYGKIQRRLSVKLRGVVAVAPQQCADRSALAER